MKRSNRLVLLIGVFLAIVAFVGILLLVRNDGSREPVKAPTTGNVVVAVSDIPLINFMLNTMVDFGRDIEPDLYKRYLAIVLDGLRPRDDLEPLPVEALHIRDFQDALARWKP